ncbi:MAG: hypothetical protein QM727_08800 [Niabella sp.]
MKQKIKLKDLKSIKLRFKRRSYRTMLVVAGIFITVIVAFNFWFIEHAEDMLGQIVAQQSDGKLRLKVRDFKFNWITNKIELQDALFQTTDTSAPISSQLSAKRITVKAQGILPLLFRKQILIDSIHLYAPHVVITKLAPRVKRDIAVLQDSVSADNDLSVSRELGRISSSINEAIDLLKIDRFLLDEGSFTLIDKTRPQDVPFFVDRIRVRLSNLRVDSSVAKRKDKITFSDEVDISTSNQSIAFPGGRHNLDFKNFRVTLRGQRVEFDSCTLRGMKGDSSRSSFRIFFDKLKMTSINFDTLYSTEVLQTDSVFCTKPSIYFNVDADRKIKRDKKQIQSVENLVQQLLGDVSLNHVVVTDANINITTLKERKTNTFSSQYNNFELHGMVIKQDSERPISVQKLLLTLRNYETTLQDGRYNIAFDSVRFQDESISLSNFKFKEWQKGHIVNNLQMPRFEVRGLSWDDLLYDNIFSAKSAVFYNPAIDYFVKDKNVTGRTKNIFNTLSELGQVMNLGSLFISDGDIGLTFPKGIHLQLDNTRLLLLPDELTASRRLKNIQHAIKDLYFKEGVFRKSNTSLRLQDVVLSDSKNGLKADKLFLQSKHVDAAANDINIRSILLDSINQVIIMDGISWKNANVQVNMPQPEHGHAKSRTDILLRQVEGNNTSVHVKNGNQQISAWLDKLGFTQFTSYSGRQGVTDVVLSGKQFSLADEVQKLSISDFSFVDQQNGSLQNLSYFKRGDKDTLSVFIPDISLKADLSKFIGNWSWLEELSLKEPVIKASFGWKEASQAPPANPLFFKLGTLSVKRPKIELSFFNSGSLSSRLLWNDTSENSYLSLRNLSSTREKPLTANLLKLYLTNFEFTGTTGKRTATNNNKLNLEFENLEVTKNDKGEFAWKTVANILSLDQLVFDSLGEKASVLTLDKGDVRNVVLRSDHIKSIGDILVNSGDLAINHTNGKLISPKNVFQWNDFNFSKGFFTIDSISLRPHQSVDDYRKAKAFNEDYLMVRTGLVSGGPFDVARFNRDTILSMGNIDVHDINLLSFKDKTQLDSGATKKLLPTQLLLSLRDKLDIDSLRLHDMYAEYWEINPQTKTLGIVPVKDLNVVMRHIKNYNLKESDSLYIDATAMVLDGLPTTLSVQESYTDSLGAFLMQLHTGALDLTKVNRVLVPLVAGEVKRGRLDSLSLSAEGNDDFSTGTMRMYHHKLYLKLLNKNDLLQQRLSQKLMTLLSNVVLIRANNHGKPSPVFFERLKDKSAINFLIKTTLSGVKSGIGVPGNKLQEKKYLKKKSTQGD